MKHHKRREQYEQLGNKASWRLFKVIYAVTAIILTIYLGNSAIGEINACSDQQALHLSGVLHSGGFLAPHPYEECNVSSAIIGTSISAVFILLLGIATFYVIRRLTIYVVFGKKPDIA